MLFFSGASDHICSATMKGDVISNAWNHECGEDDCSICGYLVHKYGARKVPKKQGQKCKPVSICRNCGTPNSVAPDECRCHPSYWTRGTILGNPVKRYTRCQFIVGGEEKILRETHSEAHQTAGCWIAPVHKFVFRRKPSQRFSKKWINKQVFIEDCQDL